MDCGEEKSQFETGDGLEFDLTLIGQACDYYPYIVFSVQRMGEMGLGCRRQPFHLAEVWVLSADGESQMIYDGETQQLKNFPTRFTTPAGNAEEAINQLKICFLTATRLKFDHQLKMEFNFRQLLFKMLRRILELAYFHVPAAAIEWEFHPLLVAANEVQITDSHLRWLDQTRYSSRQKSEMQLGGFVGEMTLAGKLNPFLPILQTS